MTKERPRSDGTQLESGKDAATRWFQYFAVLVFFVLLVVLAWWFDGQRTSEQPAVTILAGLVTVFAAFGVLFYVLPHIVIGRRFGEEFVPVPERYGEGAGVEFSREVAGAAQRLSLALILIGWFLLTCSVLLAITGSLIPPMEVGADGSGPWTDTIVTALLKSPGLLCSTLAVVGAALGWQCIDRSHSATRLASVANRAIGSIRSRHHDYKAFELSVEAKSIWLEGRMNTEHVDRLSGLLGRGEETPRQEPRPATPSSRSESGMEATRNGGPQGSLDDAERASPE
ncbi:MAG: hypothetical protein AAGB93_09120 [Planctomycetota bacterium]